MFGLAQGVLAVQVALVVGGFAYAALADWRVREVTDRLWQFLGLAGVALGAVLLAPGGAIPLAFWFLVGAFALEHMFPWSLGPRFERYEDLLDLGIYVGVIVVVLGAIARVGIGPTAVPAEVIAVLVSVVLARVLFEVGILYGGADAKGLMIAGVLLPLFSTPLLPSPAAVAPLLAVLPFSLNLLVDAALLSVAIPLGIAVVNVSRGDLHGWAGFTGYQIPVRELPKRYVWLRDPTFGDARTQEESVETSAEDRARREKIAEELTRKGVQRVWVTPQVPYLVVLAAGAVAALVAGNLLFDLFALV